MRYIIGPDGIPYGPFADAKPTPAEVAARAFAALDAMIREEHPRIGDVRVCPCGCGRHQHYCGVEYGWAYHAEADDGRA